MIPEPWACDDSDGEQDDVGQPQHMNEPNHFESDESEGNYEVVSRDAVEGRNGLLENELCEKQESFFGTLRNRDNDHEEQDQQNDDDRHVASQAGDGGTASNERIRVGSDGQNCSISTIALDDTQTPLDISAMGFVPSFPRAQEDTPKTKRRHLFILSVFLFIPAVSLAVLFNLFPLRRQDKTPEQTFKDTPSQSPSKASVPEIIELFTPFSDLEALESPLSPQNLAVRYVASLVEPSGLSHNDEPQIVQQYIMAVIYFALGGEEWSACGRTSPTCGPFGLAATWLEGKDLCTWHMVRCNDEQQVVSIATESALPVGMAGRVPSEIQFLSSLEVLQLTHDKLEGPILSYTRNMENLTEVALGGNGFDGAIDEFLAMDHPKLSVLDLNDNAFESTVPESIGKFSNLKTVDLSRNKFNGSLPSSLYTLSSLETLELGDNMFTGTISPDIGNLSLLRKFSLGPSSMTGYLPSQLFSLSKLEYLKLNDAQFSGPLVAEDFARLPNIHSLHLHNNLFSGDIPATAFGQYNEIKELRLDGNPALSGCVSKEICAKRDLQLSDLRVGCDNVFCPAGCCTDRCIRQLRARCITNDGGG